MTKTKSGFQAAFGLANKHLQTIFSTLFVKQINLNYQIQKFTLSDGDFLKIYYSKTNIQTTNKSIVILFHGLAGNYESPYIKGATQALNMAGFDTALMHFRGCDGEQNLLARSYHSGETGDALEFIKSIKEQNTYKHIFCMGFSLGANMLLKLLGELKENSLIEAAIAVSPPFELDVCANEINKGISRYYQYRLVKDLNAALEKKFDKHDMQALIGIKCEDIKNIKTFWDFDGAYTAPIHGFSSAQDYYTKSSSREFLKYIQTPTLVIHSQDDPFMSEEVIPKQNEISNSVTLEITKNGGHVGFVGGSIFKPEYYLEKRAVEFLKDF
jgi:predicted alpha/beta-fold hydrolase